MAFLRNRPARILILAALLGAGAVVGLVLRGMISKGAATVDAAGLPLSPVSYQFVSSRTEAHLYYPAATVLRVLGASEQRYPGEAVTNSAFAGAVLRTPDSPDQIYAWYRANLASSGWKPAKIGLLSTEVSAEGYARGQREFFIVGIDDPKALQAVLGQPVSANGTILEFRSSTDPTR